MSGTKATRGARFRHDARWVPSERLAESRKAPMTRPRGPPSVHLAAQAGPSFASAEGTREPAMQRRCSAVLHARWVGQPSLQGGEILTRKLVETGAAQARAMIRISSTDAVTRRASFSLVVSTWSRARQVRLLRGSLGSDFVRAHIGT
jgi:hypothetical protein